MKHKYVKYIVAVFMILTIAVAGCGCSITFPNTEESKTRTVMYKADANQYAGQSAVCWNGRIYYVSSESGEDGIHSMKPDGSDVRFEFEAPKITRLIATDDAFYYVGVYDIQDVNHQFFALFKKPHGDEKAEQLPTVFKHTESVYDAYITPDGTTSVLETQNIGSSLPPVENFGFYNVTPVYNDDLRNYYYNQGEPYNYNPYIDETGEFAYSTDVVDAGDHFEDATVIDTSTGAQVMSSLSWTESYYIKLLYVYDDTMVFGEYDKMVLMNRDTREKYKKITIDGMKEDMWIDYVFPWDEGFMAIVKQEDKNNDRLFYINTDTGNTAEMMRLNDKVMIDARKGSVLYAQGNKICCQEAGADGMGDMIYEIKMPGNVVRNNIFEIAGDWLFIHKRSLAAHTDTNQLQYKVNLKTQEVINTSE